MNDLISRQDAIEAFEKELTIAESNGKFVTIASAVTFTGAKQILERLPSAQTEIIRCKDCKHREAENGFCEGRGWPMQLVADDGFCDKGERRTDE